MNYSSTCVVVLRNDSLSVSEWIPSLNHCWYDGKIFNGHCQLIYFYTRVSGMSLRWSLSLTRVKYRLVNSTLIHCINSVPQNNCHTAALKTLKPLCDTLDNWTSRQLQTCKTHWCCPSIRCLQTPTSIIYPLTQKEHTHTHTHPLPPIVKQWAPLFTISRDIVSHVLYCRYTQYS